MELCEIGCMYLDASILTFGIELFLSNDQTCDVNRYSQSPIALCYERNKRLFGISQKCSTVIQSDRVPANKRIQKM